MVEVIQLIFDFLEVIPTNAAFVLLFGVLIFWMKRQEKKNKVVEDYIKIAEDKFSKGASNFKMIDDHFLSVHRHFEKVHEENRDNRIDTLKNIIYNEAIDPHERQNAYDSYVGLGGNGLVQKYYEARLEPIVREHLRGNRSR